MNKRDRPVVRPSLLAKVVLPMAIPALFTLGLALTVGNSWPRTIAPGSSLKLAGLVATAVTAAAIWRHIAAASPDPRVGKMAGVLCLVTGLMGWPVWSAGVLPSINGIALDQPQTVRMGFVRTEQTTISRSRERNHWVWLNADRARGELPAGRYLITAELDRQWTGTPPQAVVVTIARGLLGAQVITGYAAE